MSAAGRLARRVASAGLDWIVPRWSAPAGVAALVTTRNGGVSASPYDSMNVGVASPPRPHGDRAGAVAENRRRLRALLPADPTWLSQVHGVGVAHIDAKRPATPPVADAAVTRTPGVVLAVQVADCMPVLLSSRDGRVVAVAHAGWRGLAAGVVESTIAAMRVDATDIVAWLGPAIGPNAFEVGEDVLHAFGAARDAGIAFAPLREGKWLADLHALARRRLARAGVRDVAADASCTYTERERFFSYRRDGETGRMAALIWIDDAA